MRQLGPTAIAIVVATLAAAACGSGSEVTSSGDAATDANFPADCEGLSPADTVTCAESRYWDALQRNKDARSATHEQLGRLSGQIEGPRAGRLHFLRGTLAMALALEGGRAELVESVLPELRLAWELERNPKYPSWIDSMELVTSYLQNDPARFQRSAESSIENVELYPVGNILSITGTLSGFPLSTGLPQKAIELLERWRCDTDWCSRNTMRAPFSQPGIAFHFADAYARVGNTEKTRAYLERSLAAPGAADWPYRSKIADALANVSGFVSRYTELGSERPAIALVYANSREGCVLCHGAKP